MVRLLFLGSLAFVLTACGDPGAAMDADFAALSARPEKAVPRVEVEHVLIAFQGVPKVAGVSRSRTEAVELAAAVYSRAKAGEDFTKLREEFSDDKGQATYPMTPTLRAGMARRFGDVSWRLDVGEVGIAPYDAKDSPFGWHVIKRIQ